jgi:nucleotide-binding universal stress UspA family protein
VPLPFSQSPNANPWTGLAGKEADKMYTRILVPLDGSRSAEAVLPYVRLLAGNLKVPVELMAVIDIAEISRRIYAEQFTDLDRIIENQVVAAEKYLGSVARSLKEENITCAVEKGVTAGSIIDKAGMDKGTLITMATHGRSGLTRWLLGSIAEKVLRAANNPVLLVRANEKATTDGTATLDSVMVPLDGSKLAEAILPTVVELAKAINLKLRLMRSYYVTDMVFSYEGYFADSDALSARSSVEATSYLDAKVYQLKNEGLADVVSFVSEGEPAQMIIEAAGRARNSLIAMCTHGRSGVNRWMLGSVTEKVVRYSSNPVLVIRAT